MEGATSLSAERKKIPEKDPVHNQISGQGIQVNWLCQSSFKTARKAC